MQIVVVRIVLVDKRSGDIRHVATRVALASDVDLELLDAKELFKVLEELDKVFGRLFLPSGSRGASRKPGTDGLINPEHVGQVDPRIRVLNRSESAGLPAEATILLQKGFHGTAARTAIQPDGDLVNRGTNGGLEDEEQLARRVVLVDRDQTRVQLTNVKLDIRKLLDSVG